MELIDKAAVVAEIEKKLQDLIACKKDAFYAEERVTLRAKINMCKEILSLLNTLEVKDMDISSISENLAEAYEYLGYTSTGNLAHNKPIVSARLKKVIKELFNAGLFKLTHDEKYRMESLELKAQKGK